MFEDAVGLRNAWSGQCRDSTAREGLCARLRDPGELSHSFFGSPMPVKSFVQTLEGTILLSRELFHSIPSSPKMSEVNEKYLALRRLTLYGVRRQASNPRAAGRG
jgi:hypothetical protein